MKRKSNKKTPLVEMLTFYRCGWVCTSCDAITLEKRGVRQPVCALCGNDEFSDRVLIASK